MREIDQRAIDHVSPREAHFTPSPEALVARAFRTGLDRAEEALGFHGTSLEALKIAIERGGILGSPVAHGDVPAGGLFFYPNPVDESFKFVFPMMESLEGRITRAAISAHSNTEYHSVARVFNLDPNLQRDRVTANTILDILDDGADRASLVQRRILGNAGITYEQIESRRKEILTSGGVVLVLEKSALSLCPVVDGDQAGDDMALLVPGGILPLTHLRGIEPLDEASYDYLEQLASQ